MTKGKRIKVKVKGVDMSAPHNQEEVSIEARLCFGPYRAGIEMTNRISLFSPRHPLPTSPAICKVCAEPHFHWPLYALSQPFVAIGEAVTLPDGALLANDGVMYLCSVCPGKKLWLMKHVDNHIVSKVSNGPFIVVGHWFKRRFFVQGEHR